MSPACLENIIGIQDPCSLEDTASLSGYNGTDYPGITLQSAAKTADEKTVTGYNYLLDLRRRAMMRLNNDLTAMINNEYRVQGVKADTWRTGQFSDPYTALSAGTTGQRRGIVLTLLKPNCRFIKMTIVNVRILSNYTGTKTLQITDINGVNGAYTYSPSVALTAGVVNNFALNLKITGTEVQITLPSDTAVYSNQPLCGSGCGGTLRNDYIKPYGYDNGTPNTSEGFGIEADVMAVCDITALACDLASNNVIGQAAFELFGAMFYDEMLKTGRLNYLTIYKEEQIKETSINAFNNYRQYMANAIAGVRNHITNSDRGCGCVECGGVTIKSNV